MIALVKMPVPPSPAIARPRIRTNMLGAAPQMREPSSKTATAKSNTCFEGKMVRNWVYARLKESIVRKKPFASQEIWVREWNWFVIFGMAVAIMS